MAARWARPLLLGVALLAIFSLWRTVSVEREKRRLAAAYQEAQQLAQQLTTERDQLSQELTQARQAIETQTGDMTRLQEALTSVQAKLQQTMTEIASLQREYDDARQQTATVTAQMTSLRGEKQRLEAKLSNLGELRLAIREVKRQMHQERWAAWREYWGAWRRGMQRVQEEEDQAHLASGNRGYVVRDGVSTLGGGPRLHVHVLEPQSQ